mmetsp:Transcript_114417/g.323450  ORF Transcript_114417/g.323450 Transcript_114417/m.323450 type:complete len:230 (-) Transcript_114417:717-1406(-)
MGAWHLQIVGAHGRPNRITSSASAILMRTGGPSCRTMVDAAQNLRATCTQHVPIHDRVPSAVRSLATEPDTCAIGAAEVRYEKPAVVLEDRRVVGGDGPVRREHQMVVVPPTDADAAVGDVHFVPGERALVEKHHLLPAVVTAHVLEQDLKLGFPKLHHEPFEHREVAVGLEVKKRACDRAQVPDPKAPVQVPDFAMVSADARFWDNQGVRGVPSHACALLAHCHRRAL